MTQNLPAKERKKQILDQAVAQATELGYQNVTAAGVAAALQVQPSLIFHYFDNVADLRRQLVRAAIKNEVLPVIAQGVAMKDRQVMRAPVELRNRAVANLQR